MQILPRPSPMHKLAIYFPQDSQYATLCWMPCPTLTPPPCVPSCEECIVCEGCHDCRQHDVPLPDSVLAQGANTTPNAIQDLITSWELVPGVLDTDDFTLGVVFGLAEGEILDGCKKNASIAKITGELRDWRGPYVMVGNQWSDCEEKAKARDITMKDLKTVKKFFMGTTPKELGLAEEADDEILEKNLVEMDNMLDTVLKRK
ncbi:hypothetical protein NHQ30_008122 [Ciborinia camelliae]|nr:hypothetical protein NHQ30_008122 [Ciborinia camelliae]